MSQIDLHGALETLDRDQLLITVRRLLGEADALSSRISAVNEIGVAMNSTLDLKTVQRVVAKQAKWLLDFKHLSVCYREKGEWTINTLFGPPEAQGIDLTQCVNISQVLEKSEPCIIHEGSPSPFLASYQSQLILPLSADNVLLGSLNFAAIKPRVYSHDDMRIAYMLALQLSAAMRNANIFAELKATQEALNMRVEELDAYGDTIAHDLKTPLSNILLWSDLFKMVFGARVPAESMHYIETIHNSGKSMQRMIDQLLQLARLHHTPASMTPVSISGVVEKAVMRFQPQLEERQITLTIAPDLPDAMGYDQWVEEIFANLISNAIKYMGDKNPVAQIDIFAQAEGEFIKYAVRDSGIGIKGEDQKRLFEKFSRLYSVQAEGLGLGLSIIARMIKQLGGQIDIESEWGKGSTFWFSLPRVANSATSPLLPQSSLIETPDAVQRSLNDGITESKAADQTAWLSQTAVNEAESQGDAPVSLGNSLEAESEMFASDQMPLPQEKISGSQQE
jgi:signal transduction histidine kinase